MVSVRHGQSVTVTSHLIENCLHEINSIQYVFSGARSFYKLPLGNKGKYWIICKPFDRPTKQSLYQSFLWYFATGAHHLEGNNYAGQGHFRSTTVELRTSISPIPSVYMILPEMCRLTQWFFTLQTKQ